ncbi:rho GTPase-activating protein 92B-like isoform X2 [Ctenocephalides felis]|nr:rho GTPase-activating protein 92B-like isoform X2 [Ctenocephalides felis]
MLEASRDAESLLSKVLKDCGEIQMELSQKTREHNSEVDLYVSQPLKEVMNNEIQQLKKQLTKLVQERDTANNKLQAARRHNDNTNRITQLQDDLEELDMRVNENREKLAHEMFTLLTKETELATNILQYIKLQRAYHDAAKQALEQIIPDIEQFINDYESKPMYGYPLGEHLRLTDRKIALPIELCACALIELGICEEGLFRITAAKSKVERMCLSLDTGCFTYPLSGEYCDPHILAGALKRYLSKLPDPLLTFSLYQDFIDASSITQDEARLAAIKKIVDKLPEQNYENLRYLIKFLAELARNENHNKMSVQNIAIVFAPNLLKSNEDDELLNVMSSAAARTSVIETLLRHVDYFFPGDVNFYITYTREKLFKDCEYGFSPRYNDHRFLDNEMDSMSKSTIDYSTTTKISHSRSNSHDTSLIITDNIHITNDMKRAQSNSSLSDQSSPPQGSPKPIARRKNKSVAPCPPKSVDTSVENKPPKPLIQSKPQIIHQKPNEGIEEIREQRKSMDTDQKLSAYMLADSMETMNVQKATVDKITITSDNLQHKSNVHCTNSVNGLQAKPKGVPVAAPRTTITEKLTTADDNMANVQLRRKPKDDNCSTDRGSKPAVPERPSTLRPQSFRSVNRNDDFSNATCRITTLERIHTYNVDKQQVSLIQVDKDGSSLQRTQSIGNTTRPKCVVRTDNEVQKTLGHVRQLSQSEGNILEAPQEALVIPPSPRALQRPPRPQIPAPPPPFGHKSKVEHNESTDL